MTLWHGAPNVLIRPWSVAMIAWLYVYRYIVLLSGKETLHEALVKHSLAFSDRPVPITNELYFNKHAKGKMLFGVITSCKFEHVFSIVHNLH